MTNFIFKKLKEVTYRVKVGFVGPINEFYCDSETGIPIVRTMDIDNIDFGKLKFVTKNFHEKNKKSQVKKGDLIIARHGDNGNAVIFRHNRPAQVLNAVIIEPDQSKVSSDLLKIFFDSPFIKKQIKGAVKGSVQGVINTKHISDLVLNFSETIDYDFITRFIANLNQKIEINFQIHAKLEAMAKLIYDYWFVQFDFPDENGKPYKSSGGKMVYNNELKREIPDGWRETKLDAIISRSATGLNPRNNFRLGEGHNYYITIKNIKDKKIILDDSCDRITDESLEIIDKRSDLQVGDILFTSIEPVGITYFIQEKPTNWNINESVFTIRANYEKITSEFLYMILSSEEIKIYTRQSSAGSIHKGIRHKVLKDFNLPYGGKKITESFSEVIKPMLLKSYLLEKENQQLAKIRDWLLPILMNGQINVCKAS